ncbi:hypothetical protein [Fodinicola acaciae]|uniref:hypothetical protein n=1 Tax=Fodinicola acaciae TaxID=2681555 RepID=UPI0013D20329|nr:hypothetical protein [Fodinicola acaciae]
MRLAPAWMSQEAVRSAGMDFWHRVHEFLLTLPPILGPATGALIGTVGSFLVASYLARKGRLSAERLAAAGQRHAEELAEAGRRHTEQLARKQAALAAAEHIHAELSKLLVALNEGPDVGSLEAIIQAGVIPDPEGDAWNAFKLVVDTKTPAIDEPALTDEIQRVRSTCYEAFLAMPRFTAHPADQQRVQQGIVEALMGLHREIGDWRRDGTVPQRSAAAQLEFAMKQPWFNRIEAARGA